MHQTQTWCQRTFLVDNILFVEGKDLIVDLLVDPTDFVDVYIDCTIGLMVDINNTLCDVELGLTKISLESVPPKSH